MPDSPPLVAPLAAFLVGLCAVGAIRRIAPALGFVDNPDRWRKLHESPIPLGGGIAVWLAAWSGWGTGLLSGLGLPHAGGARGWDWSYPALATASLVVLVVGILDDRGGLRARHKLAGQLLAAMILVGLGLRIDALRGFGVEVELGIFAYPATALWILLVVNAFNLVDGMDGFCGSLGLVASLTIAFLASRSGDVPGAILALALAGALAAFLANNLPPARIYLGDAGSMMLGLMIAALSLRACSDGPGTAVSLPPMLAMLTLPLLDVATAIGRRWLSGHSLFVPDRGHIHHRLRSRLGGTVAALGAGVGLATIGAVGAAIAMTHGMGDLAACLGIVIPVGLLVGTDTFGASESRLFLSRARSALTPPLSGWGSRRKALGLEGRLEPDGTAASPSAVPSPS